MKLHPLLQPLRDLAPEWANYACFDWTGHLCWQETLGKGAQWFDRRGRYEWSTGFVLCDELLALTAINLRTQSVYLQQPDGTITEVTQAEWSAMP